MEHSKATRKHSDKPTPKKAPKPPPEHLTLTEKFVWAAHGDLQTVKALLAQHPHLLNATYNATNLETAL